MSVIANRVSLSIFLLAALLIGCSSSSEQEPQLNRHAFADTLRQSLQQDLLDPWYPRAIDSTHGGYLSHFSHDWTPLAPQNKFIVTQSRHVWTLSQAHGAMPRKDSLYLQAARHGVDFLQNTMWDEQQGGFYSLVNREGDVQVGSNSFTGLKTAYGHAFVIYGLASHYEATGDSNALHLAQRTFRWLDENAHDDEYGGYFQSIRSDGTPYTDWYDDATPPKDQNSTIHLLEAFTALYQVAPDTPRLRDRLQELLVVTRDTMTTDRGSLQLFFERDWTPVSYRDSSMSVREKNYPLDHVSFGHDVETAFLMLEAAEALGQDPAPTLHVGKRMVDHALKYGWDGEDGGFHDGGFVIKPDSVYIARASKSWWAQAEALHTFLLMENRFPDAPQDYRAKARRTWRYIDKYLIDSEYGGWYVSGVDESPDAHTESKGTIWKGTYHNARALLKGAELLEK
jgi:mannobiose 2-epimerase